MLIYRKDGVGMDFKIADYDSGTDVVKFVYGLDVRSLLVEDIQTNADVIGAAFGIELLESTWTEIWNELWLRHYGVPNETDEAEVLSELKHGPCNANDLAARLGFHINKAHYLVERVGKTCVTRDGMVSMPTEPPASNRIAEVVMILREGPVSFDTLVDRLSFSALTITDILDKMGASVVRDDHNLRLSQLGEHVYKHLK